MAVVIGSHAVVTKANIGIHSLAVFIKTGAQIASINSGNRLFQGSHIVECIATLRGKVWVFKFDGAAICRWFTFKDSPAVLDQWCNGLTGHCLRTDLNDFDTLNKIALIRGVIALTLRHLLQMAFFQCIDHIVWATW